MKTLEFYSNIDSHNMKVPVLFWFIVPTFIIVGVGVWFFSKSASTPPKSEVLPAAVSKQVEGVVEYGIVGSDHIAAGTSGSGYNSNPPSSGSHWEGASKNGAYDSELRDEQAVHNLEHGHVWVSYKPSISQEIKNKLAEIVKKDDWKVIMTPREANDSQIAVVSWGRVLKMDEPKYDQIEEFIKTYRNRGPENTPN